MLVLMLIHVLTVCLQMNMCMASSCCRVTWKNSDCDSKQGIAAAYTVLVVDSFDPHVMLGPPCTACE